MARHRDARLPQRPEVGLGSPFREVVSRDGAARNAQAAYDRGMSPRRQVDAVRHRYDWDVRLRAAGPGVPQEPPRHLRVQPRDAVHVLRERNREPGHVEAAVGRVAGEREYGLHRRPERRGDVRHVLAREPLVEAVVARRDRRVRRERRLRSHLGPRRLERLPRPNARRRPLEDGEGGVPLV